MSINRDKPDRWKDDIAKSVDFYNKWFMEFAPKAFRETRIKTAEQVEAALIATNNLLNISVDVLKKYPSVLPILRMSTCPPIARDRLVGLAGVAKNLVARMEDAIDPSLPPRMKEDELNEHLSRIANTIQKMADPDIFVWLNNGAEISDMVIQRAATIVADRLCGAVSDPIVRNAQEKRQLAAIKEYLESKGYTLIETTKNVKFNELKPGEFSFRTNVPVKMGDSEMKVNIPVDVVIQRLNANISDFPLLLEAKSAGDFANVNKRRKEEAQKMQQLKNTYGDTVRFGLFLCGYFDSGYLGYEAAEGIDWIWEHRITDLEMYGL
ncbi:MAG: XamI family restriction endonuclease [Proteocatella sp.]